MLDMQQRQLKAQELRNLRDALQSNSDLLVKELPDQLERSVRATKIIGPITSNGLEKVSKIISRLNWAIFYLTDPNFPNSQPAPKTTHPPKETTTVSPAHPIAIPIKKAPPTMAPTVKSETSETLDFGPFDPRKRK